jgi:hypothetical protein
MKLFRICLLLLLITISAACSSSNLSINTSNSNDNSSESSTTTDSSGESSTTTDSGNSDSQTTSVTINKLDISKFEGTIPTDLEEMLVYGENMMNDQDQIIYLSEVSDFGMDDDEVNDYGLWHDSINRLFCGFEELTEGSIKGILTSPDGATSYFNSGLEPNPFDGEGFCIGFRLGSFEPGGPYEFSMELPEITIRDIFNVYVNTLIVSNWEPNERIRVITYSHGAPYSPEGIFNSESYFNASSNGELWLEIDVSTSDSMWEDNLIAILMYGESGKTAELFTDKNYLSIEEEAIIPSD